MSSLFGVKPTTYLRTALLPAVMIVPAVFAQNPPPSVSAELLRDRPGVYDQTVSKMRKDLAGTTPTKFVVDGVEYTGNYVASGQNTDVYRVVRSDGTVEALRIPRNSQSTTLSNFNEYVPGIRDAQSHGMDTPKIYSESGPTRLATRMEFLDDFRSMKDILDDAVRNPNAPRVRAEIEALKEWAGSHGQKRMPDYHQPGNFGVQRMKDGTFRVKVVDVLKASKDIGDYSVVSRYESSLSKLFESEKESLLKRSQRSSRMNPTGSTAKPQTYYALEAIEKELMDAAYSPKKSPPFSVPVSALKQTGVLAEVETVDACGNGSVRKAVDPGRLSMARTIGTAGNVLNVGGIALAALMPETNPFHGEPIGVPCADAQRLKDRWKCEWDSPLNPLNNVAHCTKVVEIKPTGGKKFFLRAMEELSICEVVYDAIELRADDSDSRKKLKEIGFFKSDGTYFPGKTAEETLKRLKMRVPLTESLSHERVSFPPKGEFDFEA